MPKTTSEPQPASPPTRPPRQPPASPPPAPQPGNAATQTYPGPQPGDSPCYRGRHAARPSAGPTRPTPLPRHTPPSRPDHSLCDGTAARATGPTTAAEATGLSTASAGPAKADAKTDGTAGLPQARRRLCPRRGREAGHRFPGTGAEILGRATRWSGCLVTIRN